MGSESVRTGKRACGGRLTVYGLGGVLRLDVDGSVDDDLGHFG